MSKVLRDESPLKDVEPEFAVADHPVWLAIKPRGGFGGFRRKEFEEPDKMDVGFLYLLFKARVLAGCPFRIIDSVRDDPRSVHGELPCPAVDLQILNVWERMRISRACAIVGFVRTGVYPGTDGVYQGKKKKDGGGYHVDGSREKNAACWTRGLKKKT